MICHIDNRWHILTIDSATVANFIFHITGSKNEYLGLILFVLDENHLEFHKELKMPLLIIGGEYFGDFQIFCTVLKS